MKLILKYVLQYKAYLCMSFMGVLGFVLIQMGIPTLLKYVLNDALPQQDQTLLLSLVFGMFAILIVGFISEIFMSYANSKLRLMLFVIFVMIYLRKHRVFLTMNLMSLACLL